MCIRDSLLTIYSALTGESVASLEARYEGKGYGDFKKALLEVTADALACLLYTSIYSFS